MKLSHFFLPHPHTHKKAHLISLKALVVYILLFFGLHLSLNTLALIKPGVLGINSKVDKSEIIRLTNIERQKKGIGEVKENPQLNKAALEKAKNMFEEDYWAHYSPSGKDPWGFITSAGYKFSYAGENLARNFYTSEEVVEAWMDSLTHRENLLNPKYQDIGIAVLEGTLKGKPTVLIVQEFGSPVEYLAQNDSQSVGKSVMLSQESSQPPALGVTTQPSQPLIDSFAVTKVIGLIIIGFVAALLVIDFLIIKKRGVFRISGRHLPHLAALGVSAGLLVNIRAGSIL